MEAYKKLLQELLDGGVRFLVVGGYAAVAHGLTRATDDLDLWIEPTRENAEKTLEALRRHGIPTADLSVEIISDRRGRAASQAVRSGGAGNRSLPVLAQTRSAMPTR